MAHAASLVLDLEQRLVGIDVDDVDEAVLVLVALLGDQPTFHKLLMRSGEVGERDLDVMAVICFGLLLAALAIEHLAVGRRAGPRIGTALIIRNAGYSVEDIRV